MFQTVNISQNLGHSLIELCRNQISDFRARIKRPGQRPVFNDRHMGLPRNILNPSGHKVLPLRATRGAGIPLLYWSATAK